MHIPPISAETGVDAAKRAAIRPSSDASYRVQKGDNLWNIVKAEMMSEGQRATDFAVHRAVQDVAKANGLQNPDFILPGQSLDLSAVDGVGLKLSTRPPRPSLEMPATKRVAVLSPRTEPERITKSAATAANAAVSPWRAILDGPARLTSEYGMRKDPFTGQHRHHDGVDVAAKSGTNILPVRGGKVVFSGWSNGYGNTVRVRHEGGLETQYSHNSENLVKRGQMVTTGTPLATVGSTGRSTGPHVHFEVRRDGKAVDPVPFLTKPDTKVARAHSM